MRKDNWCVSEAKTVNMVELWMRDRQFWCDDKKHNKQQDRMKRSIQTKSHSFIEWRSQFKAKRCQTPTTNRQHSHSLTHSLTHISLVCIRCVMFHALFKLFVSNCEFNTQHAQFGSANDEYNQRRISNEMAAHKMRELLSVVCYKNRMHMCLCECVKVALINITHVCVCVFFFQDNEPI